MWKIGDKFKENKSIVKYYTHILHPTLGECRSIISGEDLYEQYHDKLPVFFIEDIYKDKCVDLEQNNNSNGE